MSKRFLVIWTIAVTLALQLVLLVSDFLVFDTQVRGRSEDMAFGNDSAVGPVFSFVFLVLFFIGPVVGTAQGIVIRTLRSTINWKTWVVRSALVSPAMSTLTIVLAIVVITLVVNSPFGYIGLCLSPLALLVLPLFGPGLVPWFFTLRSKMPASLGWLLTSTILWPLPVVLGLATGMMSNSHYKYPFYPMESVLWWFIGWTAGAALYGYITGYVLLRALKPRKGWSRTSEAAIDGEA